MQFTLKQLCLTVTAVSVAIALIVAYGWIGAVVVFVALETALFAAEARTRDGWYGQAAVRLVILVLFVLPSLYFTAVSKWNGFFSLTMNVRSQSSRSIRAVSYATCSAKAEGDACSQGNAPCELLFTPVRKLRDAKCTIDVPCSGCSLLGYEIGYDQARFLVLRIDCDGQQLCAAAEIPKGRGPRSMTVTIP